MKLSACMIAKNEERCIARCIESYRNAVDEIIVVDTGSTDATREIARRLGAKVERIEWRDDFAAAKNHALALATGDWIIFLDADEYFEHNGAKRLRGFLEKLDADKRSVDCVQLRRYELGVGATVGAAAPGAPAAGAAIADNGAKKAGNSTKKAGPGSTGGGVPLATIEYVTPERVFKNHVGIRYKGAIHEYPVKITPAADGGEALVTVTTAPPADIYILHDGYAGGQSCEKALRNLALLTRLREAGDDDPALLAYMAQASIPLRDYAAVAHYAREYLQRMQKPSADAMRALLWQEGALRMLPGPDEAVAAQRRALADEALKRFSHHPTGWLMAGNQSFEAGELEQAEQRYQKALALHERYTGEEEFSSNLQAAAWPVVRLRLAYIRQRAGDDVAAAALYAALLDEDADNPAAAGGYLACTRSTDAAQVAKRMLGWQAKATDARICLNAAREHRCDLVYLMLYDAWMKQHPGRDECFTTMQLLVGQADAAVLDYAARLKQHPLWQGGYDATMAALGPAEQHTLHEMLAEALAGALMTQNETLLRQLVEVAPGPVAAAIRLCLGDEVDTFGPGYRFVLRRVALRLAALGAAEAIRALWDEVLALAGE